MTPLLPSPIYFGKYRRWWLPAVIDFERKLTGLQPLDHHDEANARWLTAAEMRRRFSASDMWLARHTPGRAEKLAAKTKRRGPLQPHQQASNT